VDTLADALRRVTSALPGGGEARPGQVQMAEAVAHAIVSGRPLVVQAGTGTGKSLAYLVPAVLSGKKVVVATATKALQDQLASKDLPFLEEHLQQSFSWAVLKGRSNYICLQRVREAMAGGDQLVLEDVAPAVRQEVRRLASWTGETPTGDQAELDWSPSSNAWRAVSVTSEECPGATRCPLGEQCFAELARKRAAAADVVVVNLHLYGAHVASDRAVLPDHDVLVVDEAHQLEDIISDVAGLTFSSGRFVALARTIRTVLADEALVANVASAGSALAAAFAPHVGRRLPRPLPTDLADALVAARARLEAVAGALRAIDTEVGEANQRKLRAQKATGTITADIDAALAYPASLVAWVEGPDHDARLVLAHIDVAPVLKAGVWDHTTAILTSATIPNRLPERLGLAVDKTTVLDVGSPFDYAHHGLLYCAAHLPDPRHASYQAQLHDELEALIRAAGGRTLALFTSWRAMQAAADALRPRLPYRVYDQKELPKTALVRAFAEDESSCLFATAGLFQGIDVPGATLSLVTIDRLPFPRPDDPLLEARRELAGRDAFRIVDVPRASTLLAQAAGRLIRSASDRGVVAVLDKRLATAPYRWDIVNALPPMKRTKHRSEVEAFLASIASDGRTAATHAAEGRSAVERTAVDAIDTARAEPA
jgi:ATP-dependent DNA helicase DinG